MEGQEYQPIDITEQTEELRRKELWAAGDKIETAVVIGDEVFLVEEDRLWLKAMVERVGFDLTPIEGKTDLSGQADQLVKVMGKEKFVSVMTGTILEIVKSCPQGEVFKGESVKPENADEVVEGFLKDYLGSQAERGEFLFDPNIYKDETESWKKNLVYRMEAVLSVTNKLLWVMQTNDRVEAERRQGTKGTLKHLRERVMRGAERAGEIVNVPQEKRCDEKIIRYLPPKSVGIILEHLTRV